VSGKSGRTKRKGNRSGIKQPEGLRCMYSQTVLVLCAFDVRSTPRLLHLCCTRLYPVK